MANESPASAQLLTDEQRAKYRAALAALGGDSACVRCGAPSNQIGMVGATSNILLHSLAEAISGVQEQAIPVVVLMCLRCGAVYQHSSMLLARESEKLEAAPEAGAGGGE